MSALKTGVRFLEFPPTKRRISDSLFPREYAEHVNPGDLDNIREFLKMIDLADIGKKNPSQFPQILDDQTEKLQVICRDMPLIGAPRARA
jgi:hypothetical protein